MSIKKRLVLSFSFLIFIPLMIFLAWSNNTISSILLERISDTEVNKMESCSREIEAVFTDMNQILLSMASSNNVRQYVMNEIKSNGENSEQFKYQQMLLSQYIMGNMQMMLMKYPFNFVTIPIKGNCFGNRENQVNFAEEFRKSEFYSQVIKFGSSTISWRDSVKKTYPNDSYIFCAAIPIKKSETSLENIGVIYIEISEDYILDEIIRSSLSNNMVLLNHLNNSIVSSADKQSIGNDFIIFNSHDEKSDRSGCNTITNEGENTIVVFSKVLMNRWRVVKSTSYKQIFQTIHLVQWRLYLFTLLLLGFFVLIANFISERISKPVVNLSRKMNVIEQGDLSVRVPVSNSKEIGILENSFNRMLDRICELMERLKNQEKEKREAEINALQAQINPHFLFNVLSSIRWAAAANEPIVEDMVLQLSLLLKMSIKSGSDKITLKEECYMLEQYVNLHNLRQRNKITLEIYSDEQVERIPIPRFILQPLVENSIIHGFENKNDECLITIRAQKNLKQVTVEVIDNGCGFPNEFNMEESKQNQKQKSSAFSSIGLINIRDRLMLYYGSEAEFYVSNLIKNGICKGAAIRIIIPINDDINI